MPFLPTTTTKQKKSGSWLPIAEQAPAQGFNQTPPQPTPQSKPLSEQYFGTTTPSGAVLGYSYPETDTSGKPFFAYRKPGDTATTTDYRRVATSFDPRVAKPLTRDEYYNPRASNLRDEYKDAMGIAWDQELDHQIALTLSGSNNPKNLNPIAKEKNQKFGTREAELAREVAAGRLSLFAAQEQMAKEKGIEIPYTALEKKGLLERVKDFFTPPPGKSKATQSPIPSLAPKRAEAKTGFLPKPDQDSLQISTRPRIDLGTTSIGSTQTSTPQTSSAPDNIDTLKYLLDPRGTVKAPTPIGETEEEAARQNRTITGPRVLTAPGSFAITAINEFVKAVPRLALTVPLETKNAIDQLRGKDTSKDTIHLPPGLANLYGSENYYNVNADIKRRIDNGDGVLSSYIGAISQKALDVAFGAQVLATGFRIASSALSKDSPFRSIEAWKTLGSPSDKAEATKNYQQLVKQFTPDPAIPGGGNPAGYNVINEARRVLNKEGIPTVMDKFRTQGARYLEWLGRETSLGLPTPKNVKAVLTPDLKIKTPAEIQPKSLGVPALESGKGEIPQTLKHGADAETAAKIKQSGFIPSKDFPGNGMVSLTQSADDAANYARLSGKPGGEVLNVNVTAKNVKTYPSMEAYTKALEKAPGATAGLKEQALNAPYDGIVIKNGGGPGSDAFFVKPQFAQVVTGATSGATAGVPSVAAASTKSATPIIDSLIGRFGTPDELTAAISENKPLTLDVPKTDLAVTPDVPTTGTPSATLDLSTGEYQLTGGADAITRATTPSVPVNVSITNSGGGSLQEAISNIYSKPTYSRQSTLKSASLADEVFDLTTDEAKKVIDMLFDKNEISFATRKHLINAGGDTYATGRFRQVPDIFSNNFKNLIEVVESAGKVPSRVLFHESFHAYLKSFVRDAERQAILKRVQNNFILRPSQALKYDSQTYKTVEERAEEWLADDFARFVKDLVGGGEKASSPFKRFFLKIIETLRKIMRKALRLEKLYKDILAKNRSLGQKGAVTIPSKQKLSVADTGGRNERLTKLIDEAQEKLVGEKEQASRLQKLLAEAKRKPNEPDGLIQKLQRSLNPLKDQSNIVKDLWKKWQTDIYLAKESAQAELAKFDKPEFDEMDRIYAYQEGQKSEYNTKVKQIFDDLFEESNARGLDVPYRENYLPQVYTNNTGDVISAAIDYLRDLGMEEFMIQEYVNGKRELPAGLAKTLKLHPFFEKSRLFPDYKTAEKYGLTPRYKNIPALTAYYREELEKAVANKKFIDGLMEKGEIFPSAVAPKSWKALTTSFSPRDYKAPHKLADLINGQFRDESSLNFGQALAKYVGGLSKFAQEVALSAGFPMSNINFFSIGQLIKQMTLFDFKSVVPFIRANFNDPHWFTKGSLKFFEENLDVMKRMEEEGLDLGRRIGMYSDVYKNIENSTIWDKTFGRAYASFDKVFNEKTFGSFMPQLYIQTFKSVESGALAKGLTQAEAQKLAGETVKSAFGLIENSGRSKTTQDTLASIFFAPRFRESLINVFFNTAKAFTTEFKNPAFKLNRRLFAGMVISYFLYDALNHKLNGHHMWENEKNRKFALKIPLPNDEFMYIEFMPSTLAFIRNMAQGAIAIPQGDTSTATQKFGSLLSMPLKIMSEVFSNSDYFGREIYKDEDSLPVKVLKVSKYTGLQVNHPYIRETIDQWNDKKPLYQSVVAALELPAKFSSLEKIQTAEFYDMLDARELSRKKAITKFKPVYEDIQKLLSDGNESAAQARVDALTDSEYEIYKTLRAADNRRATNQNKVKIYQTIKQVDKLVADGKRDEAQAIVDNLTEEEYRLYKSLRGTMNK